MSEYVYASTVVLRHPEPGEFARVLTTAPCGTRYRDTRVERSSSNQATRWTPQPLMREKKQVVSKARWTPERVDALPKTNGYLTLAGHSEIGVGVLTVSLRCAGPHAKCQGTIVKPASVWAAPSSRPRACWHCAMIGRRKLAAPITNKGADLARAYVAKENAR
jgi:hypothetical protein